MYRNLEAELARKGASRKDLAKVLNCTVGTVGQKLGGKSAFTLPEAKRIKDYLSVDAPLDFLFAPTEETPTQKGATQ